MKEIGGYFGLEQFSGREFYPNLVAVNTGRNALAYLIRARKIRKIYIPLFLCDSVSKVCQRENCAIDYYSIGPDFLPEFDRELGRDEFIYVVNYYGQITNRVARRLKACYGNLIFDNIQAFFQEPVPGIDTIYSCRKFFGVPDGGYLSTEAVLDEPLPIDISKDRMRHVLGRFEEDASSYHKDFKENDHSFVELPLRGMSALTHNILRAIDYEEVRRRRNENYSILQQYLGQANGLKLAAVEGPYCYPFYCDNGMEIKRQLAMRKIYVPTLWPNVLEHGGQERNLAENILPLPCDQRYGRDAMEYVVQNIEKLLNK